MSDISFLKSKIVTRVFYNETNNNEFSRKLLGKYLIRLGTKPIGGMIVETESYPGGADSASHHFNNRRTPRTEVIFNDTKGLLYVYFTYGMHFCSNITAGDKGHTCVSLIRAIEPKIGIDEMIRNRGVDNIRNLCNGPAKLTKALNITRPENGNDLTQGPIVLCDLDPDFKFDTVADKRIGIRDLNDGFSQKEWRFYIKGSEFLSR